LAKHGRPVETAGLLRTPTASPIPAKGNALGSGPPVSSGALKARLIVQRLLVWSSRPIMANVWSRPLACN